MIKKVFSTLFAIWVTTALALAVAISVPSFAFNGTIGGGADAARGNDQLANLVGNSGVFQTITNVLLYVLGAVSVIMLIIGGIRYTVSQGDSSAVTSAKNTILYAIIGLVVAILAYAAVNFVIGSFAANSQG